jgi:hypothetical protein
LLLLKSIIKTKNKNVGFNGLSDHILLINCIFIKCDDRHNKNKNVGFNGFLD